MFSSQKEIKVEVLFTLKEGCLIVYPTDTVYGLGCDATNARAVSKVYHLKKRDDSKALICLVSDMQMLRKHIKTIPQQALNLIKNATKPTTIIYNNPIGFAPNLVAKDNTVAIRVVQKGFAHDLIKAFKKPIVSTSANMSGEPTPKSFSEISPQILENVDYVVNLPDECGQTPSTLVKIEVNGNLTIIRQ